jgi:hypothetical protein
MPITKRAKLAGPQNLRARAAPARNAEGAAIAAPSSLNAPNLSPLICQMLVRLDAWWSGITSLGLGVAAGA